MKKQFYILILLSIVILEVSCKKEAIEGTGISNDSLSLAGFGNRSGRPTGTPFYLPSYILQTKPVKVYDPSFINYEVHGLGTIGASLTLENTSNSNVSVNLPAGLIFLRDRDSTQSGLNLYSVTLNFYPNELKQVNLRLFCMNKHIELDFNTIYSMDVISDNSQVVKLKDAANIKKEIALYYHQQDLQDFIWNISDSTGLTKANLDSIKSW